ncbi:MAG: tetratricopeptide repeat protein, partial [Planctomycetes bacterium]|nr:tetratricopeptide repeat protein [Planctomycetota bacterium]
TLTMLLAHGKDPVDVRHTLAQWLREDGRFAEALPHVERWLREEPGDATAVVLASAVLHGLSRDADALRTLEAAVERWKARKEWQQWLAFQVAQAAYEAKQPKAAATWIEDAIRLRREAGGGGGPDAQLSAWYQLLARARSGLGETDAAVKAASAAIVARGGSSENRQDAMAALRQVLAEAKDLDAWATAYEAEVATSGLDAPTIRKAVAGIYRQRGRNDRAIAWARAARELDPADGEVHALLLGALDATGDAPGAVEALLASLRMAPKNLAAYPDLAARFARAGDETSAERARTNLVEAMPSEPDGWRELAKLRTAANRHDLAAGLWLRVTELRPNEPEGWLTLVAERLEAGDKDGARAALDHVDATTWDERFGDVRAQASKLRERLR